MTLIKNCGLKTTAAIHQAAKTGASFVGFVHHLASPRHLTLENLTSLSAKTPESLQQVVVLVDPSLELLDELLGAIRPHFWQLHRVNSPERVRVIAEHTGIPVITGISVRDRNSLTSARELEDASAHVLFDAYHPHQEGGSGSVFDWSLLRLMEVKKPWVLAGGLNPANVADALRATHAPMVDVSSGIEDKPGSKSLEKIAAFNAAVLHAQA
jgi:phosphoribosylanthranilate isomerase